MLAALTSALQPVGRLLDKLMVSSNTEGTVGARSLSAGVASFCAAGASATGIFVCAVTFSAARLPRLSAARTRPSSALSATSSVMVSTTAGVVGPRPGLEVTAGCRSSYPLAVVAVAA